MNKLTGLFEYFDTHDKYSNKPVSLFIIFLYIFWFLSFNLYNST